MKCPEIVISAGSTERSAMCMEVGERPRMQEWMGDKGKAVPLQAWIGPEGSSRLRLPEFLGGEVDCHTLRPSLPSEYPSY